VKFRVLDGEMNRQDAKDARGLEEPAEVVLFAPPSL
jgi:hypothetical protein